MYLWFIIFIFGCFRKFCRDIFCRVLRIIAANFDLHFIRTIVQKYWNSVRGTYHGFISVRTCWMCVYLVQVLAVYGFLSHHTHANKHTHTCPIAVSSSSTRTLAARLVFVVRVVSPLLLCSSGVCVCAFRDDRSVAHRKLYSAFNYNTLNLIIRIESCVSWYCNQALLLWPVT